MAGSPILPQKRMRPDSSTHLPPLPDHDRKIYELIKSRKNMGIWTADIKKETGLQNTIVTKALKSLQAKNLIKDVVSVRNKARKIFMAVEFEPSEEISGGSWYLGGSLNTNFIDHLRTLSLKQVERQKVTTVENIWESIRKSDGQHNVECTMQQIVEILRAMVLDEEVEELQSSGIGDFSHVQAGKICYRSVMKREIPKVGAWSSIPCGVCPRINECTPDGIISPKTCVYYNKWLGLEF